MGMNFIKTGDVWELAPNPGYERLLGHNVVIGAKYDPRAQVWHVEAMVEATSATPRLWRIRRLDGRTKGESDLKSDAELLALEGVGRFRLASMSPGNGGRKPKVPSISMVGSEVAPVLWWTFHFMHSERFGLSKISFDAFVTARVASPDPGVPSAKPPSFSKMRRYYVENQKTLWSDPQALAIHRENGGGRPPDPWGPKMKAFIAIAVEREKMLTEGTGAGARLSVKEMLEAAGLPLEGNLPSLRTMQDRMAKVPDPVSRSLSEGDHRAAAINGHSSIRPKPLLPLELCEADETPLDMEVLDDETFVNIGRVVVFILLDLATGIVLSATLGLVANFELAVRGLRRSMYPWISPFEGVIPRWFGIVGALKLDGAKYNHNNSMSSLGVQIGFDVGELPKRSPKMKGAVEGLVGHVNRTIAHIQAGSVMGNVVDRERVEDRRIPPLMTFGEVQGIVDDWVCNHRNVEPVDGFGPWRKTKAIPDRLWKKDIGRVSRLPRDPEIFDRVAGTVKWRTVQQDGIRIKHLVYWSDKLLHVLGREKRGKDKGRTPSILYQVVRHHNDAGRVTFIDHVENVSFECRVQAAQRRYADHLPISVHDKLVEGYAEDVGQIVRELELKKSKSFQIAHQAQSLRKTLGIEARMDAWVTKQTRRRIAGEIRTATESPAASASMVDVTALPTVPATELTGHTKLGRPADPDLDPAKARRFSNPKDGGKEIDRGLAGKSEPRSSSLKVDPATDLADLYDDGEV